MQTLGYHGKKCLKYVITYLILQPDFLFIYAFISGALNGGSYTSAHVLLNLLNEFSKSNKMRGFSSILMLFRNEFDKFNNTGAQILDSIYPMTLIINRIFGVKTSRFCHLLHNIIMDAIT